LICGKTQSDLEKYNESLQVHHVTTDGQLQGSGNNGDGDSDENSNGKDSHPAKLVTLCPEHHREWEKMKLGPDVRRDSEDDEDGD
jgi:hypothetical protein